VFNYSEEFWRIKEEIDDITEHELKYAFIRGLKKDLQIHIRIADQDQQLSFESVEKLAANIDAIQFNHQWNGERESRGRHVHPNVNTHRRFAQQQSHFPSTSSSSTSSGYGSSTSHRNTGPTPMEGVTYGRLSLQDEERYRREKRCFSCHETGRHQKGCHSRFRLNNSNIIDEGRRDSISSSTDFELKEKEE
jgi:hypothetical protein